MTRRNEAGVTLVGSTLAFSIVAIIAAFAILIVMNMNAESKLHSANVKIKKLAAERDKVLKDKADTQDKAAEHSLRIGLDTAEQSWTDLQDFTLLTASDFSSGSPDLTVIGASDSSGGQGHVSIDNSTSNSIVLAMLSGSGKCFFIRGVEGDKPAINFGSTPSSTSCKAVDKPTSGWVDNEAAAWIVDPNDNLSKTLADELKNAPLNLAESNLRNAFTAGKSVYADGQDYTLATNTALAAAEPSLTFVDGATNSADAKTISVDPASTDTLIISARSAGGTCLWIKDVTSAGGGTTYGSTPAAASCKATDTPSTGFVAQSEGWK